MKQNNIHFWLGYLSEAIAEVDRYACAQGQLARVHLRVAKQSRDEALEQIRLLAGKADSRSWIVQALDEIITDENAEGQEGTTGPDDSGIQFDGPDSL